MPSCTSPSRWPTAGTPCWPNVSSQVADALRPILCSTFVTNTPLRSPSSPVAGSKWNLGTRNSDRPLVPGCGVMPGPSGRASTRCTMFSVRSCSAEVMNRFTPSRCQVPSGWRDGPGAARADVRPGVRLGEHHRRAPAALDHQLGPAPLLRACRGGARSRRTAGRPGRGTPPGWRRGSARPRPTARSAGRRARPARPAGPAATTRRPTAGGRPASATRAASTVCVAGSNTGGWRSASAKPSASGPVARRSSSRSRSRRVSGSVSTSGRGRPVLHAEDLEEVELEVAQIAAEVPHRRHRLWLPVGNNSVLLVGNQGKHVSIGRPTFELSSAVDRCAATARYW